METKNWFEWAPDWSQKMTEHDYGVFWGLVEVLDKAAKLTDSQLFVNRRSRDENSCSLLFIGWEPQTMTFLRRNLCGVWSDDRKRLESGLDLCQILDDIQNKVCDSIEPRDAVLRGMSVDELAKTLRNIRIDPDFGTMSGLEQEIGYRAIEEAIWRLKQAAKED